jgi:hypothetical protein
MKKIFLTGFAAFLAACVTTPQDQAAWDEAAAKNTVEAYRAYLSAYPDGYYSKHALKRLETVLSPAQIQTLLYGATSSAPKPTGTY